MADRAYLTAAMPMCVIWGTDDAVIPVGTPARRRDGPGCTVEVIANAGHFPHKDHPQRFVKIVNDFIRTTQPPPTTAVAGAPCSRTAGAAARIARVRRSPTVRAQCRDRGADAR